MTQNQIHQFRIKLLTWFREAKRPLPWRSAGSWYATFLSEFLLQQTQVEQALPYYERFITTYPSIGDLAAAGEEDVLSLWSGLGYYSRGRNMLKAARQIIERYSGRFPEDYDEALSLPGIGPYTASSILSIAFNKPYPVVDGNVIRVVSRLLVIDEDVRLNRTKKRIFNACKEMLAPGDPGAFNEAVMELGALVCKPLNPLCSSCPVQSYCGAYAVDSQYRLPHKSPGRKNREKKQIVFAVRRADDLLLVKRPESGLLASMWELPAVESDYLELPEEKIYERLNSEYGVRAKIVRVSEPMVHTYSHFRLRYKPILLDISSGEVRSEHHVDWRWAGTETVHKLPVHRAHQKILEWIYKSEIKTE